MPTYRYEALRPDGGRDEGVVDASSAAAAVAQLRRSYDAVLDLKELAAQRERAPAGLRWLDLRRLSLLCRQLAILLRAGLPPAQAVDLAASQAPHRALRALLTQVSQDLAGGCGLSASFARRGGTRLPHAFLEVLQAGEASGDLAAAFSRLSDSCGRMARIRARARGVLVRLALLCAAAVAAVAAAVAAVPVLAGAVWSLGLSLSPAGQASVTAARFCARYGWALAALAALLAVGLRLYGRTAVGAVRLSRLHLSLPLLGPLAQTAAVSQFARTMSVMVSAGADLPRALSTAAQNMGSACLCRQVLDVLPVVEEGQPLAACLRRCPGLPPVLVRLAALGEASGDLAPVLAAQAELCDEAADALAARAMRRLAPAILCAAVLAVLALLLPVCAPLLTR